MKEKKGFIIAIAVMAVVIIGLVAYIVVSGKKKTKENETTTAASTTEEATTEADASDGDAEKDDKKGILVVEMGAKGSMDYRTIPLQPLHDMREIKGTYDELT